jgi:hypothetical protein
MSAKRQNLQFQINSNVTSLKILPGDLYKEQAAWGSAHTIIHQTWTTGRSALKIAITFTGRDMINTLHL